MLRYYLGVEDLLAHGHIPVAGTLTSFASFAPPGITWLLLPGALTLPDARLYEYAGAMLLLLGTQLGIFLLARACFGTRTAVLAVALYSLSELGLFLAWSLWPRGHPFFAVWMAFWLQRWVVRREGSALALALLTWSAGMYVFLEIAPAILMVPALWLVHRPPIGVRSLLAAGVLASVMWSPYLQFEAQRGFVDVASQVSRQTMLPPNYRDVWCDPAIGLEQPAQVPQDVEWSANWVGNFALVAHLPAAEPGLLLLTILSLVATRRQAGHLGVMLVIAWATLLAIVEPGRPERLRWLWPLQVIFLAAVPSLLLRARRMPQVAAWLAAVVLIVLIAGNPPLTSSIQRWVNSGWAHTETQDYEMIDFIAGHVRSSGTDHAAIGYEINIYEFMASYHIIDSSYKVGAPFDHLLQQKGVKNTDTCAEGISASDKYRIVEDTAPTGSVRFQAPSESRFRELQRFGRFGVFVAD